MLTFTSTPSRASACALRDPDRVAPLRGDDRSSSAFGLPGLRELCYGPRCERDAMPIPPDLANQIRDIVGREQYLDSPAETASYGFNSYPMYTEPAAVGLFPK